MFVAAPGSRSPFRWLWRAESVSGLGSQFTILALPITATILLHCSPFQIGVLGAASTLPVLVAGVAMGGWVDRHRCKPLIVISYLTRAAALSWLVARTCSKRLTFFDLCAGALVLGAGGALFELAFQAYMPRLLKNEDLPGANAAIGASAAASEVIGPGLAGIAVQAVGAAAAFAIDGTSFLLAAAFIHRVQGGEIVPAGRSIGGLSGISEGFRRTVTNGWLRAFAGEAGSYNFFYGMLEVALTPFAIRFLHLRAADLGLIFALGGLGAVAGALGTGRLAKRLGLGRTIVTSSIVGAAPLIAVPFVGPVHAFLPMVGIFMLRGFGVTAGNIHIFALRQVVTPPELLGRTTGVYRIIASGLLPFGALISGTIGQTFGLHTAVMVGALGVALSWIWLFWSPVRRLKSFEEIHV